MNYKPTTRVVYQINKQISTPILILIEMPIINTNINTNTNTNRNRNRDRGRTLINKGVLKEQLYM